MASRFLTRRRPAMRQGLLPEISLTLSPGASLSSGSGSYANSATESYPKAYFTDACARRKYHCGLNR